MPQPLRATALASSDWWSSIKPGLATMTSRAAEPLVFIALRMDPDP